MVQEYKIKEFVFRIEKTGRDVNGNPTYIIHNSELLSFKTGLSFNKVLKIANSLGFRKVKNQNKLSVKSHNIRHDLTQLVKEIKKDKR